MTDIVPADFYALNPQGGNILTLTAGAGTFQTGSLLTSEANNCQVYLEFYANPDGSGPVTPTSGTATVSFTPLGNVWLAPSSNPVIQCNQVAVPLGTYSPPAMSGRADQGQVTFAGVSANAPYAKVTFWRY